MADTSKGLDVKVLLDTIDSCMNDVKKMLVDMKKQSAGSIRQMFELQLAMNKLTQMSEAASSVVAASNTAVNSMARAIRG